MGMFGLFSDGVERALREADEKYQVCEYGGELWFTFSGCLVCPCSMFSDDPVEALGKMRDLYVKRHGEG